MIHIDPNLALFRFRIHNKEQRLRLHLHCSLDWRGIWLLQNGVCEKNVLERVPGDKMTEDSHDKTTQDTIRYFET